MLRTRAFSAFSAELASGCRSPKRYAWKKPYSRNFHQLAFAGKPRRGRREQRRRSRGRRIFFERRSGFPRTARQARHNRGSAPRPPARRLAAAPPAAAGDGRIPARIGAEGGQSEAQAAAVCASLSASYDAQVIVRKLRGHVLEALQVCKLPFQAKVKILLVPGRGRVGQRHENPACQHARAGEPAYAPSRRTGARQFVALLCRGAGAGRIVQVVPQCLLEPPEPLQVRLRVAVEQAHVAPRGVSESRRSAMRSRRAQFMGNMS